MDCHENLCEKCCGVHDKSGHNILLKMRPFQKRPVHKENPNVIGCNTCAPVRHESYDGTLYAYSVDAAENLKSSTQPNPTIASFAKVLGEIEKERDSRLKDISDQDEEKESKINQVRDFTEKLYKRIRELESVTMEQIAMKHKNVRQVAGADVAALIKMRLVMQKDMQNLYQTEENPDSEVYVDNKLAQSHEAEGRRLLQQVSRHRHGHLKFTLNTDMESLLNGMRDLGTCVDDIGTYNVNVWGDSFTMGKIFGSCLLPDGSMVVTDWANGSLKHLDTTHRVIDHCRLRTRIWGVTCTAPYEVAFTIPNIKKVMFATVGESMSLTRSFNTSGECRGICFSKEELFVSCGRVPSASYSTEPRHLAVYDLKGISLRTIRNETLLSVSHDIVASSDGTKIYVSQMQKDMVVLDRFGKHIRSMSDPSLKNAFGLCIVDDHILVAGSDSNNVIRFNGEDRKVVELLNDTDGLKEPLSLCYDGANSRLIVTMKNTIKVFELV